MQTELIINLIVFSVLFLTLSAALEIFSKKTNIPFTLLILLTGLAVQGIIKIFDIDFSLPLVPEIIYFLLLPVLLFESSMKMNFHQFRMQFKTITFVATFGLMLSVFIIAAGIFFVLGIPFKESLLFGAIISATDPISVISIFKNLGVPKRLALLAEGESMFNDATAVILFNIIAGFTVFNEIFEANTVLFGILDFIKVFALSLLIGAIIGYIGSKIIAYISNDAIAETTITAVIAIFSFVLADHFFHLSGVIACVAAGITVGNIGKTKFSSSVIHFIDGFWEYIGFFAISFVFFITALNLDLSKIFDHILEISLAILVVIIARMISTHTSFIFTNKLSFFNNEPNVPLKWQHILNWGGLRGVIPLILVYSLPDDFVYKEKFLIFTLSALVFSVVLNGSTIKSLITFLKIHIPEKEIRINKKEEIIMQIEDAKSKLFKLPLKEYSENIIKSFENALQMMEEKEKQELLSLADKDCMARSLKMRALDIEKETLEILFKTNYINEPVYFKFRSEIYLQEDAIEYPDVARGRSYEFGGYVDSEKIFKNTVRKLIKLIEHFSIFEKLFKNRKKNLIENRFMLLNARMIAGNNVIAELKSLKKIIGDNTITQGCIDHIVKSRKLMLKDNERQIKEIEKIYPKLMHSYQERVLTSRFYNHLGA